MTFFRRTAVVLSLVALAAAACVSTPTQKTAGETLDDVTVTARVKAALIADPASEARNINVDTRRGVVQLNGFVSSAASRAAAGRVAKDVSGVSAVENNLALKTVERPVATVVDDGVITGRVKLALAGDPGTKAYEIKVETHDGRVQLGGWVDSAKMRSEATRVAQAVDGVLAVDNNLDVKR